MSAAVGPLGEGSTDKMTANGMKPKVTAYLIGYLLSVCATGCMGGGAPVYSQRTLDNNLALAIADRRTEVVKYWLTEGASANARAPNLQVKDFESILVGQPLIIAAVQTHNVAALRMLLDHGAHVNARWFAPRSSPFHPEEKILQTPLLEVAATLDVEEVKLLLERGADAHITPGGSAGKTLLNYVLCEYPALYVPAPGDVGGGRMADDTDIAGRYKQVVALITASLQKWKHGKVVHDKGSNLPSP